ncbi:MAG TPA: PPC domain-containing protein, partial [Pirellulaceae bacterium]|nr:PPC domain-containing protein [Pirellulaceae bacterium]
MKRYFAFLSSLLLLSTSASAAPDYHQLVLESIFPPGGQRGTSVRVQLVGTKGSLRGADSIVIDGDPGITVSELTVSDKGVVEATFAIAADAVPGRRMVRVKGGLTGLTSFRWFFVGVLPEHIEGKDNNTLATSEAVTLPLVVNGRIDPALDQDCFRFTAKAGEKPVVAVMSHWLDALGYDLTNMGFADLSLEVLDANGRIVVQATDTLGYDPLIHFEVPADGEYVVRVSGMGFKGFTQAVYRLTIGEVPYPVAVFPAGGRRGETTDVEFFGPNVPPGTRQSIVVADDPFAVQYVGLSGDAAGVHELPFIRDDLPRQIAEADAISREQAHLASLPATIDGRFDKAGQDFWCRLNLAKDQRVTLAIMAQRHLRSPVDTLIEIFDASNERVAWNDDGELFASECSHDFVPFDSRLEFTAKQAGEYFVRVAEQSGSFGDRAV